jgi:hypothetical protein
MMTGESTIPRYTRISWEGHAHTGMMLEETISERNIQLLSTEPVIISSMLNQL